MPIADLITMQGMHAISLSALLLVAVALATSNAQTSAPTCNGVALNVANSKITYGRDTHNILEATITCDTDFKLHVDGRAPVTNKFPCFRDTWSQTFQCKLKDFPCGRGGFSVANSFVEYPANKASLQIAIKCRTGYNSTGNSTYTCTRFKGGNWTWTGNSQCKPVPNACPPLVLANTSSINMNRAALGSVAQILCAPGFFYEGGNFTCSKRGSGTSEVVAWTGSGTCKEVTHHACGILTIKNSLSVRYTGDQPGSNATFTCKPWHRYKGMTGTHQMRCKSTTPPVWEPSDYKCDPVPNLCSGLPNIPHSSVVDVKLATLNDVAIVTCLPNYANFGETKCVFNAATNKFSWQGDSECLIATCPTLSISNISYAATITHIGTGLQRKVMFTCQPTYQKNEDSPFVCMSGGQGKSRTFYWTGAPKCSRHSEPCGQLIVPNSAKITNGNGYFNSTAKVTCNVGYVYSGGQVQCRYDSGSNRFYWSGTPSCKGSTNTCPATLHVPDSLSIDTHSRTVNTQASVMCKHGYVANGTAVCTYNVLTNTYDWISNAVCNIDKSQACPGLEVANSRNITATNSRALGSRLRILCHDGYHLKPKDAEPVCSKDSDVRMWDPVPQCVEGDEEDSTGALSASGIAGAVIGALLGTAALVAGLIFYAQRHRRHVVIVAQRQKQKDSISGMGISENLEQVPEESYSGIAQRPSVVSTLDLGPDNINLSQRSSITDSHRDSIVKTTIDEAFVTEESEINGTNEPARRTEVAYSMAENSVDSGNYMGANVAGVESEAPLQKNISAASTKTNGSSSSGKQGRNTVLASEQTFTTKAGYESVIMGERRADQQNSSSAGQDPAGYSTCGGIASDELLYEENSDNYLTIGSTRTASTPLDAAGYMGQNPGDRPECPLPTAVTLVTGPSVRPQEAGPKAKLPLAADDGYDTFYNNGDKHDEEKKKDQYAKVKKDQGLGADHASEGDLSVDHEREDNVSDMEATLESLEQAAEQAMAMDKVAMETEYEATSGDKSPTIAVGHEYEAVDDASDIVAQSSASVNALDAEVNWR